MRDWTWWRSRLTPSACHSGYGFREVFYEQAKKEREARKSQKQVEIKEIQLRPKTNDHHTQFKVKNARGWLEDGNKVKVRVRFRGT